MDPATGPVSPGSGLYRSRRSGIAAQYTGGVATARAAGIAGDTDDEPAVECVLHESLRVLRRVARE